MITLSSAAAMRRWSERARVSGRVGLVPTMGCLHEGHLALVRAARRRCDRLVVSVFVNPLQFGPAEDFHRYPRTPASDLRLLRGEGVDVVFAPAVGEIYPEGHSTFVEVAGLADGLCGRHRPGHFRGVTTVVATLFNVVRPHLAVFGQKDAQQAAIIRRMARDLGFGVRILVVPTVRERDGLAMSSRNRYLTPAERRAAPALFAALELCRQEVAAGERSVVRLRRRMLAALSRECRVRVQYLEFVDPERLAPVRRVEGRVLVALAAFLGKTRLIDNALISGDNAVVGT
ncbi:MAG: pantoate--beta-alanine ligase [bacterium]